MTRYFTLTRTAIVIKQIYCSSSQYVRFANTFGILLPMPLYNINAKNCRFITTCKAHNWHICETGRF